METLAILKADLKEASTNGDSEKAELILSRIPQPSKANWLLLIRSYVVSSDPKGALSVASRMVEKEMISISDLRTVVLREFSYAGN